ncbi:hypothetical protein SR39_16205 [Methylobacterium radiotolerans]|nr:hypothetical protein SR39_16205 [Methylobacterium radiotolerans]
MRRSERYVSRRSQIGASGTCSRTVWVIESKGASRYSPIAGTRSATATATAAPREWPWSRIGAPGARARAASTAASPSRISPSSLGLPVEPG